MMHATNVPQMKKFLYFINKKLLNLIAKTPFQNPPSYEKLVGDLQGYYSRRINLQHRLVYKKYEDINTVVIHSMLSHYGEN